MAEIGRKRSVSFGQSRCKSGRSFRFRQPAQFEPLWTVATAADPHQSRHIEMMNATSSRPSVMLRSSTANCVSLRVPAAGPTSTRATVIGLRGGRTSYSAAGRGAPDHPPAPLERLQQSRLWPSPLDCATPSRRHRNASETVASPGEMVETAAKESRRQKLLQWHRLFPMEQNGYCLV